MGTGSSPARRFLFFRICRKIKSPIRTDAFNPAYIDTLRHFPKFMPDSSGLGGRYDGVHWGWNDADLYVNPQVISPPALTVSIKL